MSSPNTSVLDVVVNSDRVAVGIMAHMLDVANKRGAFSLDESGKIMEALKFLRGPPTENPPQQPQPKAAEETAGTASQNTPAAAPVAAPPTKPQLN